MHRTVMLGELRPHERIDEERLKEVISEIRSHGVVPIVIDETTGVILDGHHRCEALRTLGYVSVPVRAVDYQNDSVVLEAWRTGETVTKEQVVRCALCGELLPAKTTRHTIRHERCEHVPLSMLENS
ncbi:MAG: ParB N-terminal domain-containing protein [Candidatus Woesearchaeota archaeon]